MFTTYIFDLDGTLVDSQAGVVWAATQAVAAVMPEMPLPDLRPFIGPPIDRIFARALALEDVEKINALVAVYRDLYDTRGFLNATAYPGVEATLTRLRAAGARCFIVTNKPMLPTSRMLAHLQLIQHFEATVSPDSAGGPFQEKADAVAAMVDQYKIVPHSSILVGDSLDDARAASENGIGFIAVAYGYGEAHTQLTWPTAGLIDRFADLLDNRATICSE